MREVKLSTKYQIVIPRDIRHALGVKAGDRLLIVPKEDTVILLRKPKKYSKAITAIGKGLYATLPTIWPRREKAGSRAQHPHPFPLPSEWARENTILPH
jgi:AbrB family looped-hinge helix DNA binding protein